MTELLLPLALLGNGLTAGGLLIAMLASAPLRLALPANRAVQAHQLLTRPMEPLMPICIGASVVFDTLLAFTTPHHAASLLCGIAATLQAKTMLISFTKNVPINRWLASLDPEALPDDFAEHDPRLRWRNWNTVRGACALAALMLNLTVVALLV